MSVASKHGRTELVELLLKRGAYSSINTKEGKLATDLGIYKNQSCLLVKLILICSKAFDNGHLKLYKLLMKLLGNKEGASKRVFSLYLGYDFDAFFHFKRKK